LQYVAEREFEANHLSMLCNLFTSKVGYLPVMQELRMRDEMELSWVALVSRQTWQRCCDGCGSCSMGGAARIN
jgi:hypothetical protein